MPIRVYEYGLVLPSKEDVAAVELQMRLAHRYRNTLTEIELERRMRVRQILSTHPDTASMEERLTALVAQRDAARETISKSRSITRTRSESPEQRQMVKDLGSEIKELRPKVKAARAALVADAQVKRQLDEADDHSKLRRKFERARCGVYWSTYLLQEADADRARQEKMPPKFRSWNGEGRVSVQLQGGLPLDDLWGKDTQIQVDSVDIPEGAARGVRRRMCRTEMRIRIGSIRGKPIWAAWTMHYHRPIPEGSIIKVATVSRRKRNCTMWDWRVHFTVEVPEAAGRHAPADGVVALNLGYCQSADSIRSGYLVGSDQVVQEILVPRSTVDAVAKSSSIHSFRDRDMDAMKVKMGEWLKGFRELATVVHWETVAGVTASCEEPSWAAGDPAGTLAEGWKRWAAYFYDLGDGGRSLMHIYHRTQSLHLWKSPERFRMLAMWWRRHRFGGDDRDCSASAAETLRGLPTADARVPDSETQLHAPTGARPPEPETQLSPATDAGLPEDPDDASVRFYGYDILEKWRYRDQHLEHYESGMRRKALLRRRESYRMLAASLTQKYRTLLIDDTDLRVSQKNPLPEDERVKFAGNAQRLAAGSELRLVLINAFGGNGSGRVIKMSARDVTRKCHLCSAINTIDRTERMVRCSGCDALWDQDANACRNHLREHQRAQDAGEASGTAPAEVKPSRSQRLHAARDAARQARALE